MEKVALAPESVTGPNTVEPLVSVTVPVGIALPEAGVTFAAKVTLVPALA